MIAYTGTSYFHYLNQNHLTLKFNVYFLLSKLAKIYICNTKITTVCSTEAFDCMKLNKVRLKMDW